MTKNRGKKGIFNSKHFACGTYKDPTMFCPISCFLTSFPHLIQMRFCALWDLTIQWSLEKWPCQQMGDRGTNVRRNIDGGDILLERVIKND